MLLSIWKDRDVSVTVLLPWLSCLPCHLFISFPVTFLIGLASLSVSRFLFGFYEWFPLLVLQSHWDSLSLSISLVSHLARTICICVVVVVVAFSSFKCLYLF